MDEMTCPKCDGTMAERSHGSLIEAENDWHAHRSADTAQLPRITADMTAPPPPSRARSYIDGLFQG
jgi:hypothetical protein